MMHNRIVNMLAVAGMAMSALGFSKAFDRVGDRWSFDIPAGTDPMEAKFTTPYHPVRVAELHPGVIVGVAGVEGQALWCAPGASIRLTSPSPSTRVLCRRSRADSSSRATRRCRCS